MGVFHVFKKEMRTQFSKPILALTFIAVAFMPILYSGFLIKGNWDPYSQLQELPIAVVNLDQGAENNGKTVTMGNDFIEELKNDATFNWKFVSPEEGRRGMAANEYYAMITVPQDFSARAVSLNSGHPQRAELVYEANGYSNFIAAQISQNATRELRNKLSASMTEAYTRSIIENFSKVSEGLREASDGAGKLKEGSTELAGGMETVRTNLSTLTSGAKELMDGAKQLQTGAGPLANAAATISNGGSRLADGIGQLSAATASIEEGAGQLAQSASALADGSASAASGAASLTAGMEQLSTAAEQLRQGIAAAASATGQIADGSAQLTAQLQQLLQSDATLQSNASLQALLAASRKLTERAAQLNSAQQQLKASSEQWAAGQTQALQGAKQVSSGLEQLQQSIATFQTGQEKLLSSIRQVNAQLPELAAGGTELAQGARQLGEGAERLRSNLGTLAEGTGKLYGGLAELSGGAAALSEGVDKLTSGAAELRDKLSDAAKQTAALQSDDEIIAIMAQPVAIQENNERKVSNYGSGIAPYFLSLAFFAGALIYSNTFPIRGSYAPNAYGLRLFVSKLLSYGLMGIAQSLIVSTIVIYGLKLPVQSVPMFYLYTTIVGLTFMFLVQMLVTWLERPGQFVALVLLILQLVGSAGTFPYELLPGWAQALHPWLPMSYSIVGYRDVISVGSYADMWAQSGKLLMIFIASVVLIGVFYLLQGKRKKEAKQEQAPAPVPQH